MIKHIAVRLKSPHHGYAGFAVQKSTVLNSGLDKRDPALRNLTEALYDRGLAYDVDGCGLYWFQIEDAHSLEYYRNLNEVEVVFESSWYDAEKARIRGFSGHRYYDACAEMAKTWALGDQNRKISYQVPRKAA